MSLISKFAYYQKVISLKKLKGYRLKDPTFIVGCGHSGTSILLSILSNHPRFFTVIPESYIFHKNEYFRSKLLRLWVHHAYSNTKHVILEKTPSHCLKIKIILKTFLKPKIIAVIRDGRDVCCSLKKRDNIFINGFNRWIFENTELIKYLDSKNIILVRYEDFVKNPENIINKISIFLDEDIDLNVINNTKFGKKNFHKGDSDHARRRNKQTNQNIKDFSGIWNNQLTTKEKNLFKSSNEAQYLLSFFNYI